MMKKTALLLAVGQVCFAQLRIGPQINISDEFYLGAKTAYVFDNKNLPYPVLSLSCKTYASNKLIQVGTNEYYQLREHKALVQFGLEEDMQITDNRLGLTGGLSFGILAGWYNGSDRTFTKYLSVASFGIFKIIGNWKIAIKYQYAEIQSKTPHGAHLSAEFLL
jgi:hypothetical protein